MNLYFSVCM